MMGGSVGRGGAPRGETGDHRRLVMKRPLIPLVLALMVGLAAAAWGVVNIPRTWLLVIMAALLVIMLLLFWGQAPSSSKQSPPDSPKEEHPLPEKDQPR